MVVGRCKKTTLDISKLFLYTKKAPEGADFFSLKYID